MISQYNFHYSYYNGQINSLNINATSKATMYGKNVQSWMFRSLKGFLLFDVYEEYEEFYNIFVKKQIPTNQTIFSGKKLCPSKMSKIPAIWFSRITKMYPNIGLKRSVDIENADYITVDPDSCCLVVDNYYGDQLTRPMIIVPEGESEFCYHMLDDIKNKTSCEKAITKVKAYFNKVYYGVPFYSEKLAITAKDLFEHRNKFITDRQLIQHLWNNMPKINTEMLDTIIAGLKSTDPGSRTAVIDMMLNFNWQDYMFDVAKAMLNNPNIYTDFSRDSGLNKNEELLYCCLMTTPSSLSTNGNGRYSSVKLWVRPDRLLGKDFFLNSNPLYIPISTERLRDEEIALLNTGISNSYSVSSILDNLNMHVEVYRKEDPIVQPKYGVSFVDTKVEQLRTKIYSGEFRNIFNTLNLKLIIVGNE